MSAKKLQVLAELLTQLIEVRKAATERAHGGWVDVAYVSGLVVRHLDQAIDEVEREIVLHRGLDVGPHQR